MGKALYPLLINCFKKVSQFVLNSVVVEHIFVTRVFSYKGYFSSGVLDGTRLHAGMLVCLLVLCKWLFEGLYSCLLTLSLPNKTVNIS